MEELKLRLDESYERECQAKARGAELDRRLIETDRHVRLLSEKLERANIEREEAEVKLIQHGSDLTGALQRLSAKDLKTSDQDAHVWWSYVWHELRKRGGPEREEEHTDDVSSQLYKQRELLRLQAIEISSLRQEALGRQLSGRKELEGMKLDLEASLRESNNLQTHIRINKSDREIRLAEMASTIRVLSARSDIHSQLVAARQEVESEKLSSNHLRLDLEAYRSMLETG